MTPAALPHLAATPVLETERLVLRAPVAADWEAWCRFALSDRARFIRPATAFGEGEAWRAMGHLIGHWVLRGFGMFVFCDRDTASPLGMAGPWYPASWPEREIGWSIWSDEAEGKGLAFEAAKAVRNFAFDVLGWQTAVSYVAPDNLRSAALARRLGAVEDRSAACPGDEPCLVFRHPVPAELSDGGMEAYA